MSLLEPLVEWAVSHGPPNYVFILALLTSPHLWAKYAKNLAKRVYDSRFGE